MTKTEAEKGIRYLCHEWGKLRGISPGTADFPSFSDFYSWVGQSYSAHLGFRTTTSVRDDVERWFDQEFKQTWRN